MGVSSEKILRRLYPEANRPLQGKLVKAKGTFISRQPKLDAGPTKPWVRKLTYASLMAAGAFWFGLLWYYHNVFIAMTSKVDGDWADCQVVMQERHHITVSLTGMVVAYSQHERDLLTKLTDLRVGRDPEAGAKVAQSDSDAAKNLAALAAQPNPAAIAKAVEQLGPKQIEGLFSRLQVVAEQYPQLKLTENFQQFSRAVVETEHRIAELLIQYNRDVNSYMTIRSQYPGRHFAAILGFAPKQFVVVDPEELKFREASFR